VQCLLSIAPRRKSLLGWGREYRAYFLGDRPYAWDIYKDLYNNDIGRQIGSYAIANSLTREQVVDLVWDAYKRGDLIISSQDTRIPSGFSGNPFEFSLPSNVPDLGWDRREPRILTRRPQLGAALQAGAQAHQPVARDRRRQSGGWAQAEGPCQCGFNFAHAIAWEALRKQELFVILIGPMFSLKKCRKVVGGDLCAS
jgi:hypothetical protein